MQTSSPQTGWLDVLKLEVRLLTFTAARPELLSIGGKHLLFGLAWTWIVGIGRYWDNPRVGLLQHLGIGSVVYVFLLSLFLWLVIWPLRPKDWNYFRVLTFISLVSPPAIIYAIPVEQLDLESANSVNSWFLLIVAVWRVGLLIFFLRRLGQLGTFSIVCGTLLPLCVMVVVLVALNLEKAVFNFMGGFNDRTPNDSAFATLALLSLLAYLFFIPLLIGYIIMVIINRRQAQLERAELEANENI